MVIDIRHPSDSFISCITEERCFAGFFVSIEHPYRSHHAAGVVDRGHIFWHLRTAVHVACLADNNGGRLGGNAIASFCRKELKFYEQNYSFYFNSVSVYRWVRDDKRNGYADIA